MQISYSFIVGLQSMYFTSTVLLVPNHYYTNRQYMLKPSMPLKSNNKSSTMGHRWPITKAQGSNHIQITYIKQIFKWDKQSLSKHHSKKNYKKNYIFLQIYQSRSPAINNYEIYLIISPKTLFCNPILPGSGGTSPVWGWEDWSWELMGTRGAERWKQS